MGKYYVPKDISCKKKDCFANVKGTCSILCDTNFGSVNVRSLNLKRTKSNKSIVKYSTRCAIMVLEKSGYRNVFAFLFGGFCLYRSAGFLR